MSTPSGPQDGQPTPGQQSSGGQTPTSEPVGGQSSYDAAGSVRDRLKAPGPQSEGGDTRASGLSASDFRQTDSRTGAHEQGLDERQLSSSQSPEGREIQEPRPEDLDPSAARAAQPGGSDLGKFGPVPEGLVAWLVGIGVLVLATLWIGNRA